MLAAYLMNLASEMWGKKWRAVVIWHLRQGPMRFSELKRKLPDISVKVLSETLKDLEEYELVVRKQYQTIPVKVTYELHEDTKPLTHAQEVYHKALVNYFYKHHKKHNLPEDIIVLLEKEQLSA